MELVKKSDIDIIIDMKQKQNLELKHFCENFVSIKKVLTEIGAKKLKTLNQKDYFFNLPQDKMKIKARLKLRIEKNRTVLVYYERPDFVKGKDTKSDFILLPADKKALEFWTKTLGVLGIVEKKREVWKKGDTVFHLDDVIGVGKVFEV